MKCKLCGHVTKGDNALPNMLKHYKKAHPNSLKRKSKKTKTLVQTLGKKRMEQYYLISKLTSNQKDDLILKYVPLGALLQKARGY